MKRSSSKSKSPSLPPSPYMLPTSDPPVKRPAALRWMLALLAAWLMFLVAMASDRL
ncbi:hypothetical protein [Blastopirellula marina]|uniref:Co-chaperonin GroES n=1 Tax=Blastopirellula marina DSM 3645 TaxID=314230 RepID=A3ZRD2_9BACT|nr:hypothetical protein [Blastopirellula marina]EAQ80701.1 co-chaperonin GroES [Blastopirellula marina DSM 3645]